MNEEYIELLKIAHAESVNHASAISIYWIDVEGRLRKINSFSMYDSNGDGLKEPMAWLEDGECVSLWASCAEDFVAGRFFPLFDSLGKDRQDHESIR